MNNTLRVNDSFIVNALRNCGYNNYSAIADIVDNSIEPEVGSTISKINLISDGTGLASSIVAIQIVDNGVGMSMETLEEAMSLGSQTGKTGADNLGMYGAGLKTAAFSLGQKLEVYTKQIDSDAINYAVISIEDAIKNAGSISVEYNVFSLNNLEQITPFAKAMQGNDSGTMVVISNLDKLTNKNRKNFADTLRKKMGEIYNKYIFSNVVKFTVDNIDVEYIDPMRNSNNQNELLGEDDFIVDGHNISYKAWYLPLEGGAKEDEGASRNAHNQGLYIYRQNRMVGRALTLGLWARHPSMNGFRCEVFVDGNCDYLFGSTFTKTVNERTQDTMNQAFFDKLSNAITPYTIEMKRRGKKEMETNDASNPERENMYKRATDKQNKNMMLLVNRKGENKPKIPDDKEHKTRGPQKNPNPFRERTNKWLDGFRECSMGRTAEMYAVEISNNKRTILINIDHPFYKEFYNKLDNDMKFNMALIISCNEIAKQNINYYGSSEIQEVIDRYLEFQSGEISKSLTF